MPKSADESADMEETVDDESLAEESDVIELTEEVAGQSEDDASDEIDALTAEMPEFKMPGAADEDSKTDGETEPPKTAAKGGAAPASEADDKSGQPDSSADLDDDEDVAPGEEFADDDWDPSETQRLDPDARDTIEADAFERRSGTTPSAAILSRRGSDVEATKPIEHDEDDSPDEGAALADTGNDDDNVEYDRQELVKTIQMEAIDRSKIEAAVEVSALADTTLLDSQLFAPDVVVEPPRVLTTKWTEGSPLAQELIDEARKLRMESGPHPDVEPDEVEEVEVDVDEPGSEPEISDDEIEEIEPVEVEEADSVEAPETAEKPTAKPPPKPAGPTGDAKPAGPPGNPGSPTGPPPKRKPAAAARPGPAKKPPKKAKKKPVAQKADEGEMSGLVQELLDEGKEPAKTTQKKQSEAWFQKIFNEEYLRTLPKDIHRQTKREVDFLERSLRINEDMRLLDLACGFGRHSIELTRRGFEVAGLDLSMPLLKKALNEAKKQSLSIKFIHGDMRDLNFDSIFDGCFLWQTSFGYFEDRVNLQVLRGINRALKPGGRLVIDVINRDHIARDMPHRIWWEGVDCVFLEEVELDHNTSILHTKRSYIYEDGTPPLEQNSYIRLYSLHELRQLFNAAGFEPQEVSGELHHRGRYLGPASSRIILMGRKRG